MLVKASIWKTLFINIYIKKLLKNSKDVWDILILSYKKYYIYEKIRNSQTYPIVSNGWKKIGNLRIVVISEEFFYEWLPLDLNINDRNTHLSSDNKHNWWNIVFKL